MRLTSKQAAYLQGLGQQLKPQLHLGHEGLTPGVAQAMEELFAVRELVKVRALRSAAAETRALADALAAASRAAVAGVVGRTFVLYRPNPELKERLRLPGEERPTPTPAAPNRAQPRRRKSL